jgi:hypothetical protein
VVKLLMFMLILSTLVQFIHDYFHEKITNLAIVKPAKQIIPPFFIVNLVSILQTFFSSPLIFWQK